jgi:hypothetical protein
LLMGVTVRSPKLSAVRHLGNITEDCVV